MRWLVGVDEAGRGPLAGPVAVGAVATVMGFDVAHEFPGVADSKKLSEKKREQFFEALEARAARGDVRFSVAFSDAAYIDAHGIVPAVSNALARAVCTVAPSPTHTQILLDGLLTAPESYIHQTTIIRGDVTEPIISLASIAAKVMRDRLMVRLHDQYPEYGFARHKGYGTKAHCAAVVNLGPSPLHRRTFLHGRFLINTLETPKYFKRGR
ncbi:MAG: ribonuclease HII [Parcubacteria group bacterium 21-54-25]|nr:MAG: ribonuclease HII [Parcubacteria group bacterium 21-54-25]HQU08246.1 ribonuclease HII [Candidatus Paceibacterota bacterium]